MQVSKGFVYLQYIFYLSFTKIYIYIYIYVIIIIKSSHINHVPLYLNSGASYFSTFILNIFFKKNAWLGWASFDCSSRTENMYLCSYGYFAFVLWFADYNRWKWFITALNHFAQNNFFFYQSYFAKCIDFFFFLWFIYY